MKEFDLTGAKLYYGKWFVAVRLSNDATFGVGTPPAEFTRNATGGNVSRGGSALKQFAGLFS